MRVSGAVRGLATLAIAALAAGTTTASARTLVAIDGTVNPPIGAFTLKPQTLSLTLETSFSTDVAGELPGTITKATIYFPHGPRVNGRFFPSCDPRRLQALRGVRRACPAGSRLGGGVAIGTSPQFQPVQEHLSVDLYNGKGGRSIIFWLHGENPVLVAGMIVAPLKTLRGGRWGYRLTLPVPHGLQEIATDIFASLLDFKVTTGGSVRVRQGGRTVRYGYIEALACPPGALVPVRGVFDFLDGSSASTDSYIACGHR